MWTKSIMLSDNLINEMTKVSGALDHERGKANTIFFKFGNF